MAKWNFKNLNKKMFDAAGEDEELRKGVAKFLLTYVNCGTADAVKVLAELPKVNQIFSQVAKECGQ